MEDRQDIQKTEKDNLEVGAKGGAIAFLLKVTGTGLGFANQVILARILGAGGLGEVLLAISLVRISAQVAKFGMDDAMMRFLPIYSGNKDYGRLKGTIYYALRFCLLFSLAFMALILVFSKVIAISIFNSEGLLKLLPIIVVAIPAWVVRDVIAGVLKGHKDSLRAFLPETLVAPFFRLAVFLLLLIKGVSPVYAVVAFVAGEFMALLLSVRFLYLRVKLIPDVKLEYEKKKLLGVAYTFIITNMGAMLYTQTDLWVLGMFKSVETVGIYGSVVKLVLLVYFPMIAFSTIIPPLISAIHASGDLKEMRRLVGESTRWILSMAVPIILVMAIEGKFILQYLYGPEFLAGYAVLIILIAAQLIKAAVGLVGIVLQMTGHHKFYMRINVISGLLNILLNIVLVPRFGMIGAACATVFCYVMVDIISVFVIYKRLSIVTIAKGLGFDIAFISAVAALYFVFAHYDFTAGQHILAFAAFALYLAKSFYKHDVPWQLLMAKFR